MQKFNAPLYLSYVLAKYFSCSNGTEQLSWILNEEKVKSIPQGSEIYLKSISHFFAHFNDEEKLQISNLVTKVDESFNTGNENSGLVASLIFYNTKLGSCQFKAKNLIEEAQEKLLLNLDRSPLFHSVLNHEESEELGFLNYLKDLQPFLQQFTHHIKPSK